MRNGELSRPFPLLDLKYKHESHVKVVVVARAQLFERIQRGEMRL